MFFCLCARNRLTAYLHRSPALALALPLSLLLSLSLSLARSLSIKASLKALLNLLKLFQLKSY